MHFLLPIQKKNGQAFAYENNGNSFYAAFYYPKMGEALLRKAYTKMVA